MKNRTLMGLIASATIGTAIATPAMIDNQNTSHFVNKVLMVNNTNSSLTNEAVVINGNSSMNLYALSNGIGIVSKLSTGEMLTILGEAQNGYCKVKVQETGAVGYINIANMQNILNGTNDTFSKLLGNGQVVNVSSNVRLRSNPSIGNNIIGYLINGTNLNILGKQGQWYKGSVNGQIGFIYEEYVNINTTNSNDVNNQSTTNNINTNSGNTNISTTSSSNSNFTSNTNSNNHIKNTIVRTKRAVTSNSLSNINNSKNSGIKSNTSGSYLATVNKICYIVPKPGMILSQAEMNSPKYTNSKLSNGAQVLVSKKTSNLTSGWVKVTVQDGVTGYLPISDINTTNTSYVSMSMINNISANSGKHNISATSLKNSKSASTINLDNSNTLTTSSKISNSTSTTNLKNHAKNIVVKSKNSVISNSLQNKNNTNNIVYTDPRQTTFIQTAATSSSQNLQVIKNKVVKLKVLEKLYGTAPGTQNPTPIWYKVELPNGIIGYIAQSETYYKIISTNPNKNIPVFEGPDTSTIIIGSINHKKESLYVISSVITSTPMNSMKTRYYKVRTLNGKIGFIPCSYV